MSVSKLHVSISVPDVDYVEFSVLRGVCLYCLFQIMLKFLWKDDHGFVVVVVADRLRVHLQLLAEYLAARQSEACDLLGFLEVQVRLLRIQRVEH